ncbi:MAG: glycosyltransferase family 2 protein [Gemmatimonadota bacterium]
MIYVALPAHDERHTAGVLVWRLREVFAELGRDFRVLALDDASTDGTAEVLDPYDRVAPLTILRNEERRGYAASLERLVREALDRSAYHRRDGLLVMQADFTDDPSRVPELVKRFQGGADLVAGVRTDFSDAPRGMRALRFGARLVARPPGVPEGLTDPWCGFRLYRLMVLRRAVHELDEGEPLMREDGWAANLELLLRVAPHLRQWDEVEVPYDFDRRYRESRFRPLAEFGSLFRTARAARRRAAESGERKSA